MKKIVLSTLVALSIATVASASDIKLYSDTNGQVFNAPADGRTEMSTGTSVFSMTDKLDFSMLAYIGYDNFDYRKASTPDLSQFEIRRMYFQMVAHILEDPKSYFRITLDENNLGGYYDMNIKYGYLFLNKILPFTDVEIGQAHTTLLDYEEGHSWAYRSIDNVFTEQNNAGKLNASGDRGIDLKTNTQYFSSEIGVYNGEGYHANQPTTSSNSMGMDYEGRLTAHMLGTGTDYNKKHTYWDVSVIGKDNTKGNPNGTDIQYLGVHSVLNTEHFLVAGQYISAPDTKTGTQTTPSAHSGKGYSVNVEGRLGEKDQYHAFARYDSWTPEVVAGATKNEDRTYILGAAWDMNKNVQWIANVITIDNQNNATNVNGTINPNGNEYMLTAQVQF